MKEWDSVPPDAPCQCGGYYRLEELNGKPMLVHSLPHCVRYTKVKSVRDAAKFSEENRAAAARN